MEDYYNARTRWLPQVYTICILTLLASLFNTVYAYKLLKSPSRDSRLVQRLVFAANLSWLFGNIMNTVYIAYLNPISEWSCCDNLGVLISGFPSQFGASTGSILFIWMMILRLYAMRSLKSFSKYVIFALFSFSVLVYLGVVIGPMVFLQCYFGGNVDQCIDFSLLFDNLTKFAAIVFFGLYLIGLSITFLAMVLVHRVRMIELLISHSTNKHMAIALFKNVRLRLVLFLVGAVTIFVLNIFFSLGLFVPTPLMLLQLIFSFIQTFQFTLGFLLDDKLNLVYSAVPQKEETPSHSRSTSSNSHGTLNE